MTTAFTEDQKFKIQLYLGYSANFQSVDPACMNAIIAAQTNDAMVAMLISTSAAIEAIDTQIVNTLPATMAVRTEETETDFAMQVEILKERGRSLIGRMATTLGVAIRQDYFGRNLAVSPRGWV